MRTSDASHRGNKVRVLEGYSGSTKVVCEAKIADINVLGHLGKRNSIAVCLLKYARHGGKAVALIVATSSRRGGIVVFVEGNYALSFVEKVGAATGRRASQNRFMSFRFLGGGRAFAQI